MPCTRMIEYEKKTKTKTNKNWLKHKLWGGRKQLNSTGECLGDQEAKQ